MGHYPASYSTFFLKKKNSSFPVYEKKKKKYCWTENPQA